jgi:hypothetical protein
VKICPSCHQETFDGRRTCHRCGADVANVLPLDLPRRDPATLLGRWPFTSRHGELELDLDGVTFRDGSGQVLLQIPSLWIQAAEERGSADLLVRYLDEGRERERRFRVRWLSALRMLLKADRYALRARR